MKKLIACCVILVLVGLPLTQAKASEQTTLILNDRVLLLNKPPINTGGRVLLPLRDIAKTLGCEVYWLNKAQQATITRDGTSAVFKLNQNFFMRRGKRYEMDTPLMIQGNHLYIPIRYLSQAFDIDVRWSNHENAVYLATNE